MHDNVYLDNGKGAVVKLSIRGTSSGFEMDQHTLINGAESTRHLGVFGERKLAVAQAKAEAARIATDFFHGLVPA